MTWWTRFVVFCLFLPYCTTALYSRKGDVQQLTAKTLKKTLRASDRVTVLEFYAPWCGHCKNLAPIYEKTASSLKGLVNVAAIDCDEESNKRICGEYGVQGFPTIKMARPKTDARGERSFSMEDYNGARTVKSIAEHATSIMPSYVKKLTAEGISSFLEQSNSTAKVLLFTKKGTTSPTYKALSTSFQKENVAFGQVRDTQTAAVNMFGVESFPTLILLPGGSQTPVKYENELKIEPMRKFISQYVVNETNDDQSNAPISQSEGTKQKWIKHTTVEEFNVFITESKVASVLIKLPGSELTSISLVERMRQVSLIEVSEEIRRHLEHDWSTSLQDYVYLNKKKKWYIVPKQRLDSHAAVLEFLDEVRQGSAGKKIALGIDLKAKDEL